MEAGSFPLPVVRGSHWPLNWGLGNKGDKAVECHEQRRRSHITVLLHQRFVLLWEENSEKGRCCRGYESSVRQIEHSAAAEQGRIWMDIGKLEFGLCSTFC